MIKRALLTTVLTATALVVGSASADSSTPALNDHPTTVIVHDIPKAYWDAVRRCTRDNGASLAEWQRCVGSMPYDTTTSPYCTRVQLMAADGTVTTIRDDCGYTYPVVTFKER